MAEAAQRTSVRQTREATVKEHIDAENRHDPAATVATFSDHKASYDIPAFGEAGQVPDHNAIRELFLGHVLRVSRFSYRSWSIATWRRPRFR